MTDVLKQLVTSPTTANNKLPTSTSNVTLYTVPGSTQAMLVRMVICNITADPTTFRIAVSTSGATVTNNYDWVAYDVPIGGNETINFALGVGMATGGFVTVRSGTASALVFSAFGIEVTP